MSCRRDTQSELKCDTFSVNCAELEHACEHDEFAYVNVVMADQFRVRRSGFSQPVDIDRARTVIALYQCVGCVLYDECLEVKSKTEEHRLYAE